MKKKQRSDMIIIGLFVLGWLLCAVCWIMMHNPSKHMRAKALRYETKQKRSIEPHMFISYCSRKHLEHDLAHGSFSYDGWVKDGEQFHPFLGCLDAHLKWELGAYSHVYAFYKERIQRVCFYKNGTLTSGVEISKNGVSHTGDFCP